MTVISCLHNCYTNKICLCLPSAARRLVSLLSTSNASPLILSESLLPPPLAIGRLEALRRGPRGSEARGRPAGRGAEDSHLGPTTIVHKHQIYDGVWAGRRASGSRCIMYYVDDAHVNSNSNEYGRLGVSSVFGGRDK